MWSWFVLQGQGAVCRGGGSNALPPRPPVPSRPADANNRNGVSDNLPQLARMDVPRPDRASFYMPARFPRNLRDLRLLMVDVFKNLHNRLGLTDGEVEF